MDQLPLGVSSESDAASSAAISGPRGILESALIKANEDLTTRIVSDPEVYARIRLVARGSGNRACIRVLLASSLAVLHNPTLDIRNPYTKIQMAGKFSGRVYDEKYIGPFATDHKLPVNVTTAWLTPAFRNKNMPLVPGIELEGSPPEMYEALLQVLDDVHAGKLTPEDLLVQCLRELVSLRIEQENRIRQLLDDLATGSTGLKLSSEEIVALIQQHIASRNASRLPVLVVAAAYCAAEAKLGEAVKLLQSHNAADSQTGSLGDVEITLIDDSRVITTYEMKDREVNTHDIDLALIKLNELQIRPDNYIFVTTKPIDKLVTQYAATMYKATGGIEFAVLDCICFLRHFLHLFHRLRLNFLDTYQALVLAEPTSAVSQPLKEAFLNLRRVAEDNHKTE